jgi:hypothetical protein
MLKLQKQPFYLTFMKVKFHLLDFLLKNQLEGVDSWCDHATVSRFGCHYHVGDRNGANSEHLPYYCEHVSSLHLS